MGRPWIQIALIACTLVLGRLAHAQTPQHTVALLPLDAEARLEIYGQPVASEIARSLLAGGVDVVVVLPKMAVPERAKLIVDGSIRRGKADAIELKIRVRNPTTGEVLQEVDTTASNVGVLDRAAAELSSRVLPVVREQLAARAPTRIDRDPTPIPVPRAPPTVLLAVAKGGPGTLAPLRAALGDAVSPWAGNNRKTPQLVESTKLAPAAVRSASGEVGIAFEVLGYSLESRDRVPLARARVRVLIVDQIAIVFDRVVVTDTIVGDREMAPDRLAARVAREVLAILRPHMRKVDPRWR